MYWRYISVNLGLHTFWKLLDKFLLDRKQPENVGCFKYLGIMLTDDGRCTCEIKCRIAVAKAAFSKKRALFVGTLDWELRKKLVKCCIWSIALYGAETETLRAVDQKHLEICGIGEGWKRSVGPIVWEMKKCYLESMSRGISYMK